jgi:hypothetical protein
VQDKDSFGIFEFANSSTTQLFSAFQHLPFICSQHCKIMADKGFGLMTAETDAGGLDSPNLPVSQPNSDGDQDKTVFEVRSL